MQSSKLRSFFVVNLPLDSDRKCVASFSDFDKFEKVSSRLGFFLFPPCQLKRELYIVLPVFLYFIFYSQNYYFK